MSKQFDIRDYFKRVDVLDKGYIELIDGMVTDPRLKIVNAARVSFNKESNQLTDKDRGLIKYLYNHKHFSTYRHSDFTFRMKAPLFVFRQAWKHQIGSEWVEADVGQIEVPETNWNEQSGRYVEFKPEFYIPNYIRQQSKDNKQGSIDVALPKIDDVDPVWIYKQSLNRSYMAYKTLVDAGAAKEQARCLLPPAMYSECIWTISLQGLIYWLELRSDNHAQLEIQEYAKAIREILGDILDDIIVE